MPRHSPVTRKIHPPNRRQVKECGYCHGAGRIEDKCNAEIKLVTCPKCFGTGILNKMIVPNKINPRKNKRKKCNPVQLNSA